MTYFTSSVQADRLDASKNREELLQAIQREFRESEEWTRAVIGGVVGEHAVKICEKIASLEYPNSEMSGT